ARRLSGDRRQRFDKVRALARRRLAIVAPAQIPRRAAVKIHEFQAKEILRRYGVATPRGRVTADAAEAAAIRGELGGRGVVKAQIHAGGRGKGGGVKLAGSPEEAQQKAGQILGMQLVTPQTGPEGQKVQKVLVEEAVWIAKARESV